MKIALVGPSSTGKTVLAAKFAELTGIPFVSVQTRDVMAEMGFASHMDVIKAPAEQSIGFQKTLMQRRTELFRKTPSLICDRSAVDAYVYYLLENCKNDQTVGTADFCNEAMAAMSDFDLIVYMEYGSIPFRADGVRVNNAFYHRLTGLVYQDFVNKLLQDGMQRNVFFMPIDCSDIKDRIAYLAKQVNVITAKGKHGGVPRFEPSFFASLQEAEIVL